MDSAIVEAYALAFGLRLQRSLADTGTYAPVVIDRPAALANIMADIEGRGGLAHLVNIELYSVLYYKSARALPSAAAIQCTRGSGRSRRSFHTLGPRSSD